MSKRDAWRLCFSLWAWAGLLCAALHGYLARQARSSFVREGRSVLAHVAPFLARARAAGDVPAAEEILGRLAAAEGARYALLQDQKGGTWAGSGRFPEEEARSAAGGRPPAEFRVREIPGDPPSWELLQPLWADGKGVGAVRWGLWGDILEEEDAGRVARLALTWVFAAALSAALTRLLAR